MTTPYYNTQAVFSVNPSNPAPKPQTFSNGAGSSQPGTPTPAGRGRPRGAVAGAKRGRKPKGTLVAGASSPQAGSSTFASTSTTMAATPGSFATATANSNAQYPRVHWAMPNSSQGEGEEEEGADEAGSPEPNGDAPGDSQNVFAPQDEQADSKAPVIDPALMGVSVGVGVGAVGGASSQRATPIPDIASGLILPHRSTPQPPGGGRPGGIVADEEAEGDDELLPAMADDDYSAQLSWQSQSKDNLK